MRSKKMEKAKGRESDVDVEDTQRSEVEEDEDVSDDEDSDVEDDDEEAFGGWTGFSDDNP